MPIQVDELIATCRGIGIDAEGATHYGDQRDFIPAINTATKWIIGVLQSNIGDKKFIEEALSELIESMVYQTSSFSRIIVDKDITSTILAVKPLPLTYPNQSILPVSSIRESEKRDDLTFVKSDYSCKRITTEEYEINRKNPFASGNDINKNCAELLSFGYLTHTKYSDSTPIKFNSKAEIEIVPHIKNKLCAIIYVRNHPEILVVTDNVLLNRRMLHLIANKTLNIVANRRGEDTTIKDVTENDLISIIETLY